MKKGKNSTDIKTILDKPGIAAGFNLWYSYMVFSDNNVMKDNREQKTYNATGVQVKADIRNPLRYLQIIKAIEREYS